MNMDHLGGTVRTRGHLRTWTLRFVFALTILAFVIIKILPAKRAFITKASSHRPDTSLHADVGAGFQREINNPTTVSHQSRVSRKQVKKKRLPQAIIIGTKKCGTAALIQMLKLHPQVVGPNKEIHFFEKSVYTGSDEIYQKGLDWYLSQMPASYEDQITIEKSPAYFISVDPPERIHRMNPHIRLILIVRDPTTRVVSDYLHECNLHEKDPLRFKQKLKAFEEEIIKTDGQVDKWNRLIIPSLYSYNMRRWLEVFKREQMIIIDGDKFASDPLSQISRVETFLNLAPYITKNNLIWNPEKGFYCMKSLEREWCMKENKGRPHPDYDPEVMSKLRRFFAPLNEEFYKMVNHNFSWPTS